MNSENGDRLKKLRDKAEEELGKEALDKEDPICEDSRMLLQELRVHEIELEMQNDELLRAQYELELSRRSYTDLFDFAPIGYLVFDGEGVIRKANLKSAEMFRKNRSELAGRPLTDFIKRDYQDVFYLFRKGLKRTSTSETCELRLKSGAFMILEGVSVGEDEVVGELYRLALIDITKQKLMEEDRMRLKEEILQLQKLEGLRNLAGGVAHDLNNFMQAIIGNADIAIQLIPREDEAYEYIEGILRSARNSTHLARQMLSYSGKARVVNEPVHLDILARDNTALMRAAVNKKTELVLDIEEDVPSITADSQQLQQMLMNLILNADEAIGGEPGRITLSTGKMQADRNYLDRAFMGGGHEEGEYVYVEVADTGSGIDKEKLARLFDPFYSTKSGGRGLGLSMVHGIAHAHKAALIIDSAPGKGSSFRVLFPVRKRETDDTAVTQTKPVKTGALKGGVALVVDDEPQILNATKRILERNGFEAVTAFTGREAVEVFSASPEKFSVVIMDLLMPEMSGDEAASEIRALRGDIGIIFTSGYHKKNLSALKAGPGITVELEKPYGKEKLLESLRYVLEGRKS